MGEWRTTAANLNDFSLHFICAKWPALAAHQWNNVDDKVTGNNDRTGDCSISCHKITFWQFVRSNSKESCLQAYTTYTTVYKQSNF